MATNKEKKMMTEKQNPINKANGTNGTNGTNRQKADYVALKQELTAICSILKGNVKCTSLPEVLQEVGKMAFRDDVSGLANRTYFKYRLDYYIKAARISRDSLVLILFDLDDFKHINDTLGHAGGDSVIEQVSEILGEKVRSVQNLIKQKDVYARYGGDEFAIILPGSTVHLATKVAERFQTSIRNHPFVHKNQIIKREITASFAIASFHGELESAEDLIERADKLLLQAKAGGKNRIKVQEA